MQTPEQIAERLSPAQLKAILWCNPDGSARDFDRGSPREVSFWTLSKVVFGDPTKEVAAIYSLCRCGENPDRKSGLWPMTTWALTPLGLAVREILITQEARRG